MIQTLQRRLPHLLRKAASFLFIGIPATTLNAQFEDDFEGYSVGANVSWGGYGSAQVLDSSSVPELGAQNKLIDLTSSSQKLLTNTDTFAPGEVLTFSVDIVEYASTSPSNGLQVGFGTNGDLNSSNASVRLELLDGTVSHISLSGNSTLTEGGPASYSINEAFRLYIVVNDTNQALTDYRGTEDLAAGSYEVWMLSGGTIQKVLEATIARSLDVAGFRTWSGHDSEFYVDNVRLDVGAVFPVSTGFVDDFEADSIGGIPDWTDADNVTVVDGAAFATGGAVNQAVDLSAPSASLLQDVEAFAVGRVTTFAADLMETDTEDPTSALRFGFGTNSDLNSANASARVGLADGTITFEDIGGLSSLTQFGSSTYPVGTPFRLYMVVNDTTQALIDYEGGEDLAAGSYEVWLRTDSGLQHILEATLARSPEDAGFRTFSGVDVIFQADKVIASKGVDLSPTTTCSMNDLPLAAAAGVPFDLGFSIASAPSGATYEVISSSPITAPAAAPTTDSGQVAVSIDSGHREHVTLTLQVRDSSGVLLASASALVMVFDYRLPEQLHHPSIVSSQGQLERMVDLIQDPSSVAKQGWDALLANPRASLSYTHDPYETVFVEPSGSTPSESAFRSDATAARAHALQWVVTGNPAHRDKCLEIMNDWGRTFRSIKSTGFAKQVRLESAWALPIWLSAADIMRYFDNGSAAWDPTDMAGFHHFMDILYGHAYLARNEFNNNWDVSACLGIMSYGAWMDDQAIFDEGLSEQLARLDELSNSDGEIPEICRDTWHPQYSVVAWTDSAELARNQGRLDLYEATFDGQTTPRLAIILEYFADLMLGNTQPPCGSGWGFSYPDSINFFDNYETPYNHYIAREQATYLPSFAEFVEDFWRPAGGSDDHFLLWSRLTHGGNDYDALPLPETYDDWVASELLAYGITDPELIAPDGDPNGDGISNSLHYWTGTNPVTATAGEYALKMQGLTQLEGQDHIALRMVEKPNASAHGRKFYWSMDLQNWSEVDPASLQVLEDRGTTLLLEATFPATETRGFFSIGYPSSN